MNYKEQLKKIGNLIAEYWDTCNKEQKQELIKFLEWELNIIK